TGASVMKDGEKREDDVCVGFLLADNGATFRVVLADLTVCVLSKAGKDESDVDFCGYREISLKAEAQQLLRELRSETYFSRWQSDRQFSYYDRLQRSAQIFAFARACARRGEVELGESLVKALERHPPRDGSNPTNGSLQEELVTSFANVAGWNLRISLRDGTQTWATLRDRARKLQEAFPNEEFEVVAKMFATLADEDAEHARTRPASLDGLTSRERARELTWQLRDEQNPGLDGPNFWPRPWPFELRKSNGAMAGLRELGFEAVPALIEESHSDRMSRSIFRSERYGGGVILTKTSDLAVNILNDIAGVNFYRLADFANKKAEEGWPAIVAAIEDWWHTVESKGEKQYLVGMVLQGGARANGCVERLRARYLEVFVETMVASVRTSASPHDRAEITKKLWGERDPKADEFLREELRNGPTLGNRVAAAYGLRQRGLIEAEEAIREEWTRLVKRGLKDEEISARSADERQSIRFDEDSPLWAEAPAHALNFLTAGDAVESFHLFLRTLRELSPRTRVLLIRRIGGRDFTVQTPTTQRASPATRMLIREILLNTLDDTTGITGEMESAEDGPIAEPRLCDLAAEYLHEHWQETFKFEMFASESVRERQRITMLNIHRREQDLAELPLPVGRPKVAAAKANHVAAIEWATNSAAPGAALSTKLSGWKGQPLNLDALVTILTSYAKTPPAGTRGLRCTAFRDGDSTGVIVRLSLVPGAARKTAARSFRQFVSANREMLLNSSGGGTAESATKRTEWFEFSKSAGGAIATPVDKPFMIRAEVLLWP
ncbi:MAG TPA: hypothetical protein VFD27_21840, partial [Chthoniobacteraceae bacterium]|nr:hypothetical protein [Chthoniobacteraceae bacterium]